MEYHDKYSESEKTQKLQDKFKMSDNTITSDKTVIAEKNGPV